MADWVLVKHWHDSGGIEAVYGPYTQEQAEWLRTEIAADSCNAWTAAELRTMPGQAALPPPAAPVRDPGSTTAAVTAVATPPAASARRREFGPAIGFTLPDRSHHMNDVAEFTESAANSAEHAADCAGRAADCAERLADRVIELRKLGRDILSRWETTRAKPWLQVPQEQVTAWQRLLDGTTDGTTPEGRP